MAEGRPLPAGVYFPRGDEIIMVFRDGRELKITPQAIERLAELEAIMKECKDVIGCSKGEFMYFRGADYSGNVESSCMPLLWKELTK